MHKLTSVYNVIYKIYDTNTVDSMQYSCIVFVYKMKAYFCFLFPISISLRLFYFYTQIVISLSKYRKNCGPTIRYYSVYWKFSIDYVVWPPLCARQTISIDLYNDSHWRFWTGKLLNILNYGTMSEGVFAR